MEAVKPENTCPSPSHSQPNIELGPDLSETVASMLDSFPEQATQAAINYAFDPRELHSYRNYIPDTTAHLSCSDDKTDNVSGGITDDDGVENEADVHALTRVPAMLVSLLQFICSTVCSRIEDTTERGRAVLGMITALRHWMDQNKIMGFLEEVTPLPLKDKELQQLFLSAYNMATQEQMSRDEFVEVCGGYLTVSDPERGMPFPSRDKSRFTRDFTAISMVATGGFGSVYKVKNRLDGAFYAVKRIPLEKLSRLEWSRVQREVLILAGLHHANIVQYNTAWLEQISVAAQTDSSDSSPVFFLPEGDGLDAREAVHTRERGSNKPRRNRHEQCNKKVTGIPGKESNQNKPGTNHEKRAGEGVAKAHGREVIRDHGKGNDHDFEKEQVPRSEIVNDPASVTGTRSTGSIPSRKSTLAEDSSKKKSEKKGKLVSRSVDDLLRVMSRADLRQAVLKYNLSFGVGTYGELVVGPKEVMKDSDLSLRTESIEEGISIKQKVKRLTVLNIQMELCDTSLKDWICRRNANLDNMAEHEFLNHVDLPSVLRIMKQILHATAHFHSKSLLHRDLKPGNVFLTCDMEVKVGDFGLATAHLQEGDTGQPSEGETVATKHVGHSPGVGTSVYSSPEQLSSRAYSTKSDMFSLGVIFFELLFPFAPGATAMERLKTLDELRNPRGDNPPIFWKRLSSRFPDQAILIQKLVSHDPKLRPNAADALHMDMFGLDEEQTEVDIMVVEIEQLRANLRRCECERDLLQRKLDEAQCQSDRGEENQLALENLT